MWQQSSYHNHYHLLFFFCSVWFIQSILLRFILIKWPCIMQVYQRQMSKEGLQKVIQQEQTDSSMAQVWSCISFFLNWGLPLNACYTKYFCYRETFFQQKTYAIFSHFMRMWGNVFLFLVILVRAMLFKISFVYLLCEWVCWMERLVNFKKYGFSIWNGITKSLLFTPHWLFVNSTWIKRFYFHLPLHIFCIILMKIPKLPM